MSEDSRLAIIDPADNALAHVGQIANDYASRNVFTDYLSRKADNTIRRQAADLARFAEFLDDAGNRSRKTAWPLSVHQGPPYRSCPTAFAAIP